MTDAKDDQQPFNDKKLFVGNLDFSITNTELEILFSPFGKIMGINVREDRNTNKPKGFAFVTFEDSNDASEALSLNGTVHEGRILTVKRATLRGSDKKDDTSKSWVTVPTPLRDKKVGAGVNTNSVASKSLSGRKTWDKWAGPTV